MKRRLDCEDGRQEKHVKQLLKGLIGDTLGQDRVDDLLNGAKIKVFPSSLLHSADVITGKATYIPKKFASFSNVTYFKPDGWVQMWLGAADQDPDFTILKNWPVAYHGTDSSNLGSILEAGLRKPGEIPLAHMAHGSVGAGSAGAVYTSPSLWLASHPVYSQLVEVAAGHWVQFVFKVRVKPWSYKVQGSTLSNTKHWEPGLQLDPNFDHNEELEWLNERSEDVVIVGLMIREFGSGANPTVYGQLAANLENSPEHKVQYAWTRTLRERLRSGDFCLENSYISAGELFLEWPLKSLSRAKRIYKLNRKICSRICKLRRLGNFEVYLELDPAIIDKDVDDADSYDSYELTVNVLHHRAPIWYIVSVGEWSEQRVLAPDDEDYIHYVPAAVFDVVDVSVVHIRYVPVELPIDLRVCGSTATWRLGSEYDYAKSSFNMSIVSPTFLLVLEEQQINMHMNFVPRVAKWPNYSSIELIVSGNLQAGSLAGIAMELDVNGEGEKIVCHEGYVAWVYDAWRAPCVVIRVSVIYV